MVAEPRVAPPTAFNWRAAGGGARAESEPVDVAERKSKSTKWEVEEAVKPLVSWRSVVVAEVLSPYWVCWVKGKVELTVTAPVAPEIVTPDPATNEVTPVLVMVSPEPMIDWPAVTERPVEPVIVPVATFANVLTPEKYGMLPCTAAVVVESPPKDSVSPVRMTGQGAARLVASEMSRPETSAVPTVSQVPAPAADTSRTN